MDRLAGQSTASSSIAYTYDLNGNRTAKVLGGTSFTNMIASDSNRMTQVQDPTGTASIQYDAAGNVIHDGTSTCGYSDRGRMGSATTPSGTLSFLYNGLQQRMLKASAVASAYYLYDEAGRLLGEYDASGNAVYETADLGSAPVAAMKGGVLYNVYADQIDTPRMITGQDNTMVWRWDAAEAFGATAPEQNPSGKGVFVFNQRFPGQVVDVETGLNQNWNREYNARLGRYIQSDPIGLEGGINSYAYVNGSPSMHSDPYGLYSWSEFGSAASNAVVGFGDAFLIPTLIRNALDIDGGVNKCSASYGAGEVVGTVWSLLPFSLEEGAAYGATKVGMWLNRGRSWRIGPGRMPGIPAEGPLPALRQVRKCLASPSEATSQA